MIPAQPLKSYVATILPDAKQNLEGVKDTYPRRDLVGLANARCIGVSDVRQALQARHIVGSLRGTIAFIHLLLVPNAVV